MAKLTAKQVQHATDGVLFDGEGLYLRVSKGGAAKSWVLRLTFAGKRIDVGLGSARDLPLADARREARRLQDVAKAGGDPRGARKAAHPVRSEPGPVPQPAPQRAASGALTFSQAMAEFLPIHLAKHSERKQQQWWQTLRDYACTPEKVDGLGDMPVDTITPEDVQRVLEPIWHTKPETADKTRGRIEKVLGWATVRKLRTGGNPAAWTNNLEFLLGRQGWTVQHHAAMPWGEVPAFWTALEAREGVSARCLQWLILTAVRSGEARGARWEEIDEAAATWTIPAARMKMREAHVVPLPAQALSILHRVRGLDADLVFPSPSRGKDDRARPMDYNAFNMLFRRMGVEGITTHGFRTSFRTWCSDVAEAPRELAEAALAHRVGSAVELAYARSRMVERRRPLMQAWAAYVTGTTTDALPITPE